MPGYALRVDPVGEVQVPVWRALREAPAPLSVADLHRATAAHPNAIQHRLARWSAAGLVTPIAGRPQRFAMTDAETADPEPPIVDRAGRVKPRRRTAHDRLWSAMRVLKRFDLPTLLIVAEVTRRSAETFINRLLRSGHLSRCGRRGNGRTGEWSVYRLDRNSGPAAPSIVHRATDAGRRWEVLDRNTGDRVDVSPRQRRGASADAQPGGGEG